MTVDELREKLRDVPGDLTVVRADESWYYVEVQSVTIENFCETNDNELGDYIGPDWARFNRGSNSVNPTHRTLLMK